LNGIEVVLFGIKFQNPVMVASGTFGYGEEYSDLVAISELGALVTKTITPEPRAGNPPPRIVETPSGMLSGKDTREFAYMARKVSELDGVDAIEINLSCPNVGEGGVKNLSRSGQIQSVVSAVCENTDLPVISKLSPNMLLEIEEMAIEAANAGSRGISLINTLMAMEIDVERRKPVLGNITGGLSGPAILPVGLYAVNKVAKVVDIPVIGIGGISSYMDALKYIVAGASAIQIGTANFVNPRVSLEIIEGIRTYIEIQGIDDITSLIGSMEPSG
jgi:dihydroorotate dehydrogenase (NAD+) catalytic subunit